jgi:hypothetical protein
MSFSQHLVLWLHVAFVIFTIGPVTLAIMSTPRYIRKRDIRILRYLTRMTFIFAIGSLGVLVAGYALASMISKADKPWIIVSATLFVVAVLLLGLINRDQRHAIKALESAAPAAATATAASHARGGEAGGGEAGGGEAGGGEAGAGDAGGREAGGGPAPADQPPGGHAAGGAAAAGDSTAGTGPRQAGEPAIAFPEQLASVERGRIAMIGGVVGLIWLVILVLMVWNT